MSTNFDEPLEESSKASSWKLERLDENEVHEEPASYWGAEDGSELSQENAERSRISLMLIGIFGGVYFLMTLAWVEIAKAYSAVNTGGAEASGTLGYLLQVALFWLAPAAPLIWYLASVTLTQRLQTLKLSLWLLVGVLLVFPYPFFFRGGIV